MREINFARNITELRKKAGVTQEELAEALHISGQAVSKWETGTNQPDTQTLAAIADYFHVSIDYLYYGESVAYDDIYARITDRVAAIPEQMGKESYQEALKIFAAAHHGISHKNLINFKDHPSGDFFYDIPAHLSNQNGLSLLSGRGYGAIVTRDFFSWINRESLVLGEEMFNTLAVPGAVRVLAAVVSMSDISYFELKEKLPELEEAVLMNALDALKNARILVEKESKHKALGRTYDVQQMFHTCLCILLATLEMQRYSFRGVACCMSYGDYPIPFGEKEASSN